MSIAQLLSMMKVQGNPFRRELLQEQICHVSIAGKVLRRIFIGVGS